MYSTLGTNSDADALDEGAYLFGQAHDDLLSMPLSHDNLHLKVGNSNSMHNISGLNNLMYGQSSESNTSSVHYGGSQASDINVGHKTKGEEQDGSVSNGYVKEPVAFPSRYPHPTRSSQLTGLSKLNDNNGAVSNNGVTAHPPNGTEPHKPRPLHQSTNRVPLAHTPQYVKPDSSASSTPELIQSHEYAGAHPSANLSSIKGKFTGFKANSSIPAALSWEEFARQSILAADSSRLNPFALHPEEYKLLRDHITHAQVTIYLNIRNGILRLWTRNPLVYVSLEEAVGCARDKRYFGLAKVAYHWLLRNGYINSGCVEIPKTSTFSRARAKGNLRRTVIVVGAGMSGLGCARHLEGLFAQYEDQWANEEGRPPKVIVLEARPRVGGRVYSHPFRNQSGSSLPPGHRCTAEMGAQIVTGFEHGNPMNTIIRGQLGIPYHGLRDNTILYDYDGTVVEKSRDVLVERLYNDVLERASVYRSKPAAFRTVEGDRNLILFGRDPSDTGEATIARLEESNTPLPANAKTTASTTEEKPSTGVEKLAGRAYQLSAGFNPNISAAEAVRNMGWPLKEDASIMSSLELDTIAKASKYPTLGQTMDDGIKQYQRIIDLKPRDMRLLSWHHANLEYANAVSVNQLSLSGWDQDIGNEFEGEHTEIIGGYQQVPRGLWQCPDKLDVHFNTPIHSIQYDAQTSGDGKAVRVETTNGQTFEADHIILTTPLGVLKSGSIRFQPALPDWKRDVIERMGFGLLNKVILVYEEAFWEPDRDMFGLLNEAEQHASLDPEDYSSRRGRFYLFWNCIKTSGKPTLVALMAGDAAHYAENTSNEDLVKEVTDRLDLMFAPSPVPLPSETIVTRWSKDPYARGSYSYVGPKTRTGDYDVMARPHGPLHFAGEATCGTHPATVHGAYLSGLRAAAEVAEAMMGPIQVPSPLVEKKTKVEQPSQHGHEVKRKGENGLTRAQSNGGGGSKSEDYEASIIGAIVEKIGERPVKPSQGSLNPFLLYTKDEWYSVKEECDEARRRSTGNAEAKASKQEIRTAIGLKWRTSGAEVKKPYHDQAQAARDRAAAKAAEFSESVAEWDREAARIRQDYVQSKRPGGGNNEEAAMNSGTAMELGAAKRMRRL